MEDTKLGLWKSDGNRKECSECGKQMHTMYTDMRLTDEQIVKALECCVSSAGGDACRGCPYEEEGICILALQRDSLDLIKRQQAEIEDLKADFEARGILQDILEEEKLERHIDEMLMDAIEEGADNA